MTTRTRTQTRRTVAAGHRRLDAATISPRSGLIGFQDHLRNAVREHRNADEFLEAVLDITMKLPRVIGATFLRVDSDGKAEASPARLGGVVFERGDYVSHLAATARKSQEDGCVAVMASPDVKNLTTICAPIQIENPLRPIIAIAVADAPQNLDAELLIPQVVCSYIALWQICQINGTLDGELNATSAVLELVGRLGDCKSQRQAAYTLANELRDYFQCAQVAVGLRKSNGTCKVQAVSGMADFDQQSKIVNTFRAACDETVVRGDIVVWPPLKDGLKHGVVSHKQLTERLNAEAIVSCPLKAADGSINGVLVFLGQSETLHQRNALNVLNTLPEPVGSALQLVKQAEGGLVRRTLNKVFSALTPRSGQLAVVGIFAVVAAMFVPVTYRIRTVCTAEPVVRRLSVAPHEGLLESTLAEPGDVVTKGQLLAQMDGREIRWELAGLEADSHRAGKEHDSQFVNQNVPEAQMARLEQERLQLKSKLLKFRESNLEIRSPIDGIVLSGSLDRRENFPVTVGQALYEIAPLDSLRIEIAVPDDEISHIQVGIKVSVTFDGVAGPGFDGKITRIHPRSEVRNAENVFVAEVIVDNPDGIVRPGMAGVARIYGARRALGWTLFHKPWEHVVSWVRW